MKKFKIFILITLVVSSITFAFAHPQKNANAQITPTVEVLYFHGAQRCRTCIALQNAVTETLNTQFAKEQQTKQVVLREINISTKEGEKIADKYEIAWSSLLIVRKEGNKEKIEDLTDKGFRYAVKEKDKIQSLISETILKFLK